MKKVILVILSVLVIGCGDKCAQSEDLVLAHVANDSFTVDMMNLSKFESDGDSCKAFLTITTSGGIMGYPVKYTVVDGKVTNVGM